MTSSVRLFHSLKAFAFAWGSLVCSTYAGTPSFQFVDVSPSLGISGATFSFGLGRGIAAADYDNDGFVDFFLLNPEGVPDRLYHNLGNGQFEEIASQVGLASTQRNRCALWFDYDDDHDLDLVVATEMVTASTTFRLYRQNSDHTFTDVTLSAGLWKAIPEEVAPGTGQGRSGMCAGDINNDGLLDLYAPMWNGAPHLFLNNGNSTFTDITSLSHVAIGTDYAHQCVMTDFDGDGWLDIYVSIDFGPNQLWRNNRNLQFTNVAADANANNSMNDMGVALGDYDSDGDLDIYVTNIFAATATWNVMLRNDSAGSTLAFTEIAQTLGISNGAWGWGTTFLDADNDGHLDIAATNGWSSSVDSSKFFWHSGTNPPSYSNVSSTVGFDDTLWGSALVAFDYDRDGDLDLLQACMEGPIRLLQNQPATAAAAVNNNYLVIKPRMNGRNHFAIGTVVGIEIGSDTQMRLITAGTSYLGQEPAEAFFGVGTATNIDLVTIKWPDRRITLLTDVGVNQVLTVTDSVTEPFDIPTVSHWGMATLMLLTLIGASLLLRFKEQAASIRVYRAG